MSRSYAFTVAKVIRHDDQRDGSATEVIVRRDGGREYSVWVKGWHDPESLLERLDDPLRRLAKQVAFQESETALIGKVVTVDVS